MDGFYFLPEFRVKYGENIARERKQRCLKQKSVAEQLKIPPANLCGIEKGRRPASMETYFDIISVVGCHPDKVFYTGGLTPAKGETSPDSS
jgi:transcriptional regulator with XRE-family HTH domain